MAVTSLFDTERNGKRGTLMSLLSGGFGATEDAPDIPETDAAPRRSDDRLRMQEYLRGLDMMIRSTERAQINQTLVKVSPHEVQALVEKAAKAKARYLASALDMGNGEGMPDTGATKALEAERQRHAELDAGLRALLDEMRRGNVQVEGVADESAEPGEAASAQAGGHNHHGDA
ncbi:hypothetical protein SAMN05216241_11323 [Limimonas halophila]|uniref:Uncharacterized protein n=1 Tax=Limimonas halophila TaxID=1082479 RepID=A0A1G7UAS4_9PROT|nr:hypothetical protein [Limimonas halophila]SDG44557.1 hypothetical protein SAMN05216241_11323 [Limimonas halophila]